MHASPLLLVAIGVVWTVTLTFVGERTSHTACPAVETSSARLDEETRNLTQVIETETASIAKLAHDAKEEFDKALTDYKSNQLTAEELQEVHSRWVSVQQAQCELALYSHLRIEDILRLNQAKHFVNRGVGEDGAEIGVPADDIQQTK